MTKLTIEADDVVLLPQKRSLCVGIATFEGRPVSPEMAVPQRSRGPAWNWSAPSRGGWPWTMSNPSFTPPASIRAHTRSIDMGIEMRRKIGEIHSAVIERGPR